MRLASGEHLSCSRNHHHSAVWVHSQLAKKIHHLPEIKSKTFTIVSTLSLGTLKFKRNVWLYIICITVAQDVFNVSYSLLKEDENTKKRCTYDLAQNLGEVHRTVSGLKTGMRRFKII